jgi:thiol-disulfide isomerase/thioredoxin
MAVDLEKNLDGVYRAEGDMARAELKVWTRADVAPPSIEQALGKRRMHGVFEAGKGSYAPPAGYPVGSDVRVLTISGKDIGALEPHVVPGKVTVFDFYADWCGPCKVLDRKFATVVQARSDVAIRKLNIVGFSSPLSRAWSLRAIPFVVIYGRSGKKSNELSGSDPTKIAVALGRATVAPE